jgi:hypothetical protein
LSFVFVPLEGLSNVARSLVANQPSSSSPTADELGRHAKDPQQLPGQRSLIAIVDTANAAAFNFPLAALRNAAGTDVIPTTASLTAGLAAMTTTSAGTLQPNPASADPAAYPLTLVQYAMAPTSGTAHAKAAQIARFLSYAADQGQVTGGLQGGLPAGYLPLTATLRTQVAQVADAVLHQTGKPPATTTPTPPVVPVTGTGGGAGSGDLGNPFPDGGSTPTTAPTTPAPAATPTASPSATASRTSPKLNAIDYTPPRSTAGAARLIVPFIIALTVSTGLVGPALLAMGSDRRRVVLASTRDAVHRVLRRRRPS